MPFPVVVGDFYKYTLDFTNPWRCDANFLDGREYKVLDVHYDMTVGMIGFVEINSEHGPVLLSEDEMFEHFLPTNKYNGKSVGHDPNGHFEKEEKTLVLRCECGKDKHGFASHSDWCPLYEERKW